MLILKGEAYMKLFKHKIDNKIDEQIDRAIDKIVDSTLKDLDKKK